MTILVLDNDLGFLFWLAKALEPSGYHVVPADTVARAGSLLRRLRVTIDLLMVNPKIEGAAEFTKNLRRRMRAHLKVVLLVANEELQTKHEEIQADAERAKPELHQIVATSKAEDPDTATLVLEWRRFVQGLVSGTAHSWAN